MGILTQSHMIDQSITNFSESLPNSSKRPGLQIFNEPVYQKLGFLRGFPQQNNSLAWYSTMNLYIKKFVYIISPCDT